MTWQRSLIVLSAVLIVVAFALATAGPIDVPLELWLGRISPTLTTHIRSALPLWMGDRILWPLLTRPAWLVPLALGLCCAGGALTVPVKNPVRRRRLR